METPEDSSSLRTLADAVSEPAVSAPVCSGPSPEIIGNGVWVADAAVEGFDINKVFDDGDVVVLSERVVQTDISVEKTRLVGPDGPVFGLGTQEFGDIGAKNVSGESEPKGNGSSLGPGGKIGEMNGSASNVAQNGNNFTEDLNDDCGGIMMEMDGEKGDGDDDDDDAAGAIDAHGYRAGDLVWGKIKSHPWWPGQIYDPKDASENAVKFNQKGRLLVAYFGDGSFAWCMPSQLIPFAEHFEDMSKQSNSKSFVNAIQEAVDEIGRLVELEMACKCLPDERRKGLNSPVAGNAGIRVGVLVPEGDIGKLLSFRYDPAELLSTVEDIAVCVSFGNVLELAILKSWLSAFYRARCGYSLPVFCEGLQVEGLEEKSRQGALDTDDVSLPIEVPLQGPLDDKIYHRRKQKSVAELMAEGTDIKSRSRKRSIAIECTNASNPAKQKRNIDEAAGKHSGGIQASGTVRKRGRKKTGEISNAENGHVQAEEQMRKKSLAGELKEDKPADPDDNVGEGSIGTEEISSPRERKKSKYLSPPYTSPRFRSGNTSSKKELEKESEKICNIDRMGELMAKAAGILLDSPTVMKSNGQSLQEKLPEGYDNGQLNTSAHLNLPRGKQDQKKIIDTMDANEPVEEVLAGVISVAVNPSHSWNDSLLDLVRRFVSSFRSSIYLNGASYKLYHKRQPGRKRKSLSSEEGNLENGDAKSPESKARRTVGKKSTQAKSDTPKVKKAARGSVVKSNNKQVRAKTSPASLVVTFAPGFSLPSKDDIIRTFSKFGVLMEKETVVLHDSGSVQIVYTSPSGAEAALRASLSQTPFSPATVDYKLCYSLAAPMAVESSNETSSPLVMNLNKSVTSRSAADESQLGSIRQKLEIMTSMLEKCDGKISTEEVSKLDGEIKRLFETVRKMAVASLY